MQNQKRIFSTLAYPYVYVATASTYRAFLQRLFPRHDSRTECDRMYEMSRLSSMRELWESSIRQYCRMALGKLLAFLQFGIAFINKYI